MPDHCNWSKQTGSWSNQIYRAALAHSFAENINMQSSRVFYLDWLRTAAIIGVLFYHSARPFITDDPWHINNTLKSDVLSEFSFWLSRVRMPLLFFISGAVTWFMVKKRTAGEFFLLRIRRLFIPLVVGMLIVVPPQVYMERVSQGFQGNYLDFYGSIFKFEPYPKGNFSWHHLWFIAYLFLYDILLIPFFSWCKSVRGKIFINKLAFLGEGIRVYLLMAPSVILYSLFVLKYPTTNDLIHDPLSFTYWLLFLLVGWAAIIQPAIMDSLERNRRISLTIAFVFFLGINYLRWNDFDWFTFIPNASRDWRTPFYLARQPLFTWFLLFAIVGYGKKYLNFKMRFNDYISQSLYPFYILHQTVIVVISYYVVKSNDGIGLKYLFIVSFTLLISALIYHLLIRPYALTRILFGMKTEKLVDRYVGVSGQEKKIVEVSTAHQVLIK